MPSLWKLAFAVIVVAAYWAIPLHLCFRTAKIQGRSLESWRILLVLSPLTCLLLMWLFPPRTGD